MLFCCIASLYLVRVPLVDSGATTSWRYPAPASTATSDTKTAAWPSAALLGFRTVA